MTYENMKRLHKAYSECGADKPRLDIEQWYPEFKAKEPKVEPKEPSDKLPPKPPTKKKVAKKGVKSEK